MVNKEIMRELWLNSTTRNSRKALFSLAKADREAWLPRYAKGKQRSELRVWLVQGGAPE